MTPFRHTTPTQADIDWYAFLARPRLPSPPAESLEQLHRSSILVTGAGGSIGNALSLRLASLRPHNLVLLDASEQALHRLSSTFATDVPDLTPHLVLGSVNDSAQLDEICAMHRPSLIFHAAAYKHVSLLEENPLAAIANNAIGTDSLAACAHGHGVSRIVLLSTDKAVAPASILGASKRIAEEIILAHKSIVVRLCNVLGTDGSVVETFQKQIRVGVPITISDREAERFFLTCDEAVDLLIASAITSQPASLLIPQLERAHSIVGLAEFLIETMSPMKTMPLNFTGLRPGEKLHEALWSADEAPAPSEVSGCLQLARKRGDSSQLDDAIDCLKSAVQERDLLLSIRCVQRLVPDYTPSPTLMAQVQSLSAGAA